MPFQRHNGVSLHVTSRHVTPRNNTNSSLHVNIPRESSWITYHPNPQPCSYAFTHLRIYAFLCHYAHQQPRTHLCTRIHIQSTMQPPDSIRTQTLLHFSPPPTPLPTPLPTRLPTRLPTLLPTLFPTPPPPTPLLPAPTYLISSLQRRLTRPHLLTPMLISMATLSTQPRTKITE